MRKCAHILEDTLLLGKLSSGDMIAQDAVYHINCLSTLYRKAEKAHLMDETDNTERQLHGIALAELVLYIDETRDNKDEVQVLKLTDLAKMYSARLNQLGVDVSGRLHTTELKNRILAQFPDMQAHREGRDVLLAFKDDIVFALKKAYDTDFDEAIILPKAANIVRRDMMNMNTRTFSGSFDTQCQQNSVPQTLMALVGMILDGTNLATHSNDTVKSQVTLTLAQLLKFNSTLRRREGSSAVYNTAKHETPLPIYTGLLLHAETRKRELVDKLHDLGLCRSYSRVMALSTDLGNTLCEQFEKDQLVCPPKLRTGLFTTSAVDNIDHNPSSTTAQGSLHGTGISLFQHPSENLVGHEREPVMLRPAESNRKKMMSQLPDRYTGMIFCKNFPSEHFA